VHFAVPKQPGESLLVPAIGQCVPTALENRARLDGEKALIGGVPLGELRTALRCHVLALAKCDPHDPRPLIASGHQPGFPHPGILYKHAVLEQVAPAAIAVNVVVESDTAEALVARVPACRDRRISVEAVTLAHADKRLVLAEAPKPDRRLFEDRLSEVRRAAATLDNDDILKALDRFAALHREEYADHDSLAALLTAYRRRYFPTPHVRELTLTALCETDAFRTFAAGLIEGAERFFSTHNECLARHRRERRIRTTVNPFPDLRRNAAAIEAPLWHVGDDGRRASLFVEPGARSTALRAHDAPLGAFSTRAELDRLVGGLELRPKAVTLTMFLRLCLADLFVHGVSGANYDSATDAILRDAFGIEPPAYGVASLTLSLPLEFDDGLENRVQGLAGQARRMTWNPDEFVPEANPLRRRKRDILAGAGGHLTRAEHEAIEAVRVELLDSIGPARRAHAGELEAARAALAAQRRLAARDFPYFLYPLPQLQAAMQSPNAAHTG
jgi:hypothetical protein